MKVLVVDDDRDLTAMLAFALRRAGFEAMLAHDGDSALRFLREQTPDVVVLDINLTP